MAGDSTAYKGSDAWRRGWVAVLIDYFDMNKIHLGGILDNGRFRLPWLRQNLGQSQLG
jgi:hypothetical protein